MDATDFYQLAREYKALPTQATAPASPPSAPTAAPPAAPSASPPAVAPPSETSATGNGTGSAATASPASQPTATASIQFAEAHDRSTVHVAYYSAFLVARQVAGLTLEREKVHQKTIDWFKRSRNRLHFGVSKDLEGLRDLRTLADYDIHLYFSRARVGGAISQARRILVALGRTV